MRWLPFEYAVRNLGRAPQRFVAASLGSGLVVGLVMSAAAFVRGMEKSLSTNERSSNVMLLGAGSEDSLERSQISAATTGLALASVAGVRERLGQPYASPEVHMAAIVHLSPDSPERLKALLRGVTPAAFLVHPQVRIVEGRAPRASASEILVGGLAGTRLGVPADRLAVGRQLWFDGRPWTIVGRFEAPGSVINAEIWMPLIDLQVASKREDLSGVVLTLDEAEFADVDVFARQRLDLELVAIREQDYYAKLLSFYGPIRGMVWATAALIAVGGLFGGLNTLYAAFAARIRELATLQTLGWSRVALVMSLIQESVLMSSVGALLAAGVAVGVLDGVSVRFSMGAFGLVVDGPVMLLGLLTGLALGVIGALPPAWRCLRLPIPDALRAA